METGAEYGHAAGIHHHLPPQLAKELSHHHHQQAQQQQQQQQQSSSHHRNHAHQSQQSHHAKLLQQQQQQQQQHQSQPASQPHTLAAWYAGAAASGTLRSASSGRRASYGHNHYGSQQQQQPTLALPPSAVNYHDMADTVSIGSGHSAQRYIEPSHPQQQQQHQQQHALRGETATLGRGSVGGLLIDRHGSTDRFGALDDPLSTACLQPPSPAPSNDHYVMGLPAPGPAGGHHYGTDSGRHYGTIQRRTASPSNIRYRHSLTENYRDISPQCDRYVPPPAHFLGADTYGYLGSNVHTPIKRYVPTPPPQESPYPPLSGAGPTNAKTQALMMSALLGQGAGLHLAGSHRPGGPSNAHPTPSQPYGYAGASSTLPYGFRVKSGAGSSSGPEPTTISPPKGFETPDHHYGTSSSSSSTPMAASSNGSGSLSTPPARVRPPKCPGSTNGAAPPPTAHSTSTLPHGAGHVSRSSSRHSQGSSSVGGVGGLSVSSSTSNGYRMSRTSSAEFLDQPRAASYRVSTPVSVMSEPNAGSNGGSASCLHCSTLRRTTGVHQTTQTTGPISPPPNGGLPEGGCHSVPASPASLTSPQPPAAAGGGIVSSPHAQHQHHLLAAQYGQQAQQQHLPPQVQATIAQSQHSQTYDTEGGVGASPLDGGATIPRNAAKHQFGQSGPARNEPPSMESLLSASSSRSLLMQQQYALQQPLPSQVGGPTANQQQAVAPQQQPPPPSASSLQPPTASSASGTPVMPQPASQPSQQQQSVPPPQQLTSPAEPHASQHLPAAPVPSPQPTAPAVPPPPTLMMSSQQPMSSSPACVPYAMAAHVLPPPPQHAAGSLNDSPASTLQRSSNAQLLRIPQSNLSCKQRAKEYVRRETAKFFGVPIQDEEYERTKWEDRQRRFACRRFGSLRDDYDGREVMVGPGHPGDGGAHHHPHHHHHHHHHGHQPGAPLPPSDRPDILPAQSQDERETELSRRQRANPHYASAQDRQGGDVYLIRAERKPSVPAVICSGLRFLVQSITRRRLRTQHQWSRSFAPAHVELTGTDGADGSEVHCDGLAPLQDGEAFFDTPTAQIGPVERAGGQQLQQVHDNSRQLFVSDGDRATGSGIINGWRTKSAELHHHHQQQQQQQQQQQAAAAQAGQQGQQGAVLQEQAGHGAAGGIYGQRISSHILDGVLDNSLRPVRNRVKLLRPNLLDERYDYRPFFTYWINTVQIVVMILSLICYGFGPIGLGMEYRSAQVLVTSLSLQQVGPLPSIAGVLASLMLQLVLCHWKSLKKPHLAMIKLLTLGCTLFGLGTLPLQQNFTGLIAGLLTGIALTLAFVPFVNVTKHSRKSKINLIWTCVTLQFVLYAVMFIIFYAFPTLFESLNFIDGNQLLDPNAGHGYHDHYSLYDGYNNYNPLGGGGAPTGGHTPGGGQHNHAHGSGIGGGGGGNGGNHIIGTYNNNYKSSGGGGGGNVMHNHHDYTAGGGGGGTGGPPNRNVGGAGGSGRGSSAGNNLLKTISLCEKGQCVVRQPRQTDTNA
uniref:Uncharacterized protein n=1 Tax=Anopheles coluzzii TaxID=1518534 RepID=A0A6E8W999_ANOCL